MKFWDSAFSGKGAFRSFLLGESVKDLNRVLEGYISSLDSELSVTFNDDLTIRESYGKRSGGQISRRFLVYIHDCIRQTSRRRCEMAAKTPEQVNEQLIDALTRGDIDAAIDLYEPEASFVNEGEIVIGTMAIRGILEAFAAVKPEFKFKAKPTVQSGDIALTGNDWSLAGTDAEGNPLEMSGSSYEVVRRGADGNWRFAIDNPDAG